MKNKIMYTLIALFALSACGAKIESGQSNENKNQKVSSPETQDLKVSTDQAGAYNQITNWDFIGGDFTRFFKFRPAKNGELNLTLGSIMSYNCNISNMVEIFRLETVENGQVTQSVVLNTGNTRQKVKKDKDYQIKVTLQSLGACEYLAYDFNTRFVEINNYVLPAQKIIENQIVRFETPMGEPTVVIDLLYKSATERRLYVSSSAVGGMTCSTMKTSYEWVEFDSTGKEVWIKPTTGYADYLAVANTQHALRLTISGIQNCNIQSFSYLFNSY